MKFKISSGLKSIIGKDLITDDFVAIFELVKNSFDAYASRVDIFFGSNEIFLIDNGKGMSKDDITNKWLFVAYSAKADNTENSHLENDYRKGLRAKRNSFAGNKGVGRFSCDRLGASLDIYSKKYNETPISKLSVNWGLFETDQASEFGHIELKHQYVDNFPIPKLIPAIDENDLGTVLHIKDLRASASWDRTKILNLKSSIAKLIDPFGIREDFNIYIHATDQQEQDSDNLKKWNANKKSEFDEI